MLAGIVPYIHHKTPSSNHKAGRRGKITLKCMYESDWWQLERGAHHASLNGKNPIAGERESGRVMKAERRTVLEIKD